MLAALPATVTLKIFTREGATNCPACRDAQELLEELAANSGGMVRLESHDLDRDAAEGARYRVNRAPAIVVLGEGDARKDYGIRFFGAPDGYEFATLIEDVRLASRGAVELSPGMTDVLAHLTEPLHLQVFVTPTCPYCPRAAVLAHSLAIASEQVTADVVDGSEFPELAARYRVRSVPRTVVNDTVYIDGSMPESAFLAQLMPLFEAKAAGSALD